MKIDCISDLHGAYPKLDAGDLLIVAGDLTARDLEDQYYQFNSWLCEQDYNKKIVISGNHDGLLQKDSFQYLEGYPAFEYLQDSGTKYKGIKIWGSPWTPTFYNWHFMKDRGEKIKEMWDLIPRDTEILITHGPTFGILDRVKRFNYIDTKTNLGNFINSQYEHAGCEELRKVIEKLPNLKLHVFGHIHEGYGTCKLPRIGFLDENDVLCVNCSIMDGEYNPVNKPITIHFDKHKGANVVL